MNYSHVLVFSLSSSRDMSCSCSCARTNRSSKLSTSCPPSDVVTDVRATGCSLMCPGLGSSNSSTRPSACVSSGSGCDSPMLARMSGEGGGLRDLERRASSWRKGMGEKRGVGGADVEPMEAKVLIVVSFSASVNGGKLSYVDVTRRDFSTARKYFPTEV